RQRLGEAGYSMTWRTYDGQIENQTGAIEEAGLVRARAIICDSLGGDATTAAVKASNNNHVPVFLMNKSIDQMGVAGCQIVTNEIGALKELAAHFAENVSEGAYISISEENADQRTQELSNKTQVALERIQGSGNFGEIDLEQIGSFIDEHPELRAIVCITPEKTRSVAETLVASGRRDQIKLYCVHGDNMVCGLVDQGIVEACLVKPGEELASQTADKMIRYFRQGRADWVERQYVTALLYTGSDES
ncbi:MAG: hypothetical protein KBS83_04725, partial [Lachnospiraceae bacterium]|nr:hypothetical protein [Candidatus Equihabitans merdae]